MDAQLIMDALRMAEQPATADEILRRITKMTGVEDEDLADAVQTTLDAAVLYNVVSCKDENYSEVHQPAGLPLEPVLGEENSSSAKESAAYEKKVGEEGRRQVRKRHHKRANNTPFQESSGDEMPPVRRRLNGGAGGGRGMVSVGVGGTEESKDEESLDQMNALRLGGDGGDAQKAIATVSVAVAPGVNCVIAEFEIDLDVDVDVGGDGDGNGDGGAFLDGCRKQIETFAWFDNGNIRQ